MLLTSIMVTAVFSVALTAKSSGDKGERKLRAAVGARAVSAMLRNYVTADPLETTILGPGTGAGAASWSMTSGGVVDARPCGTAPRSIYALEAGDHCLTGVLDQDFEDPPYNARVRYNVVYAGSVPQVAITTTWDEP